MIVSDEGPFSFPSDLFTSGSPLGGCWPLSKCIFPAQSILSENIFTDIPRGALLGDCKSCQSDRSHLGDLEIPPSPALGSSRLRTPGKSQHLGKHVCPSLDPEAPACVKRHWGRDSFHPLSPFDVCADWLFVNSTQDRVF